MAALVSYLPGRYKFIIFTTVQFEGLQFESVWKVNSNWDGETRYESKWGRITQLLKERETNPVPY